MSPIDMIYLPLQHLNRNIEPLRSDYEDPYRRFPLFLLEGNNALAGVDRGEWSSAAPSRPSVRPSKLSGRWLFGRLPVEMLFVCLCVRLGGVHYAIAMVRRSIERVELHRA